MLKNAIQLVVQLKRLIQNIYYRTRAPQMTFEIIEEIGNIYCITFGILVENSNFMKATKSLSTPFRSLTRNLHPAILSKMEMKIKTTARIGFVLTLNRPSIISIDSRCP